LPRFGNQLRIGGQVLRRKQFFSLPQEIGRAHAQGASNLQDKNEGWHVLAALDLPEVTALHLRLQRKCLLGNTEIRSDGTNRRAKCARHNWICRRRPDGPTCPDCSLCHRQKRRGGGEFKPRYL
jgi:hypothetical protein